jgi:FAD/FMN-containing dehydrogenase
VINPEASMSVRSATTISPFSPPVHGRPLVNDVHSRLNPTRVHELIPVASTAEVQEAVRHAARVGRPVCVGGGWHAMGAQQFATGGVMLDTRPLRARCELDAERGLVTVDAGIQWPELVSRLLAAQEGRAQRGERVWGIAQKQTGADRLSIGGAIAANVHGRGLTRRPFVADVESFRLVDAAGDVRRCSRGENAELFSHAAGGYGLVGVVTEATLRLVPRHKVRRVVEVLHADDLMAAFEARIAAGFEYGDFQFALDPASSDFLRRGIFSCYLPVSEDTPIPDGQRALSEADWKSLLHLAHADKARAWDEYSGHYLKTSGQVYWADTQQLGTYVDDYHRELDARLGAAHPGSEMITEIYVPRPRLADFLAAAAEDFRRHDVNCIYGTIRLIERDDESFLAWAREPWACAIFNLHTEHTPRGVEHSANAFRRLIDLGLARGGSYYLTYHKWATREQLLACHPRIPEFLRRKDAYDPEHRFQSDWWRHQVALGL